MGQGTPAASEASALGLVPSGTSPTRGLPALVFQPPAGAFVIDQEAARMRRMRSGVLTWARLSDEWTATTGRRWWSCMVTLTYGPSASWEPRHISQFLACVAEWARRQGIRLPYTWVMELTKAGVPHYHVLLWVPRGYRLPKPDRRGWWPHGSTRIEQARSAVGYVAKYVSKGWGPEALHALPKGARISGRGGLPRCSEQRREAQWWRLPGWLREYLPLDRARIPSMLGLARRCPAALRARLHDGTGRLTSWITEAGELLASPWVARFCIATRRVYCWRVSTC